MVSRFDDMAAVHDYDEVGVSDRREAVGHDDNRASAVVVLEVVDDVALVEGVERVCGFVEHEHRRPAVDRAGNQNALSLPLAYADAVAPDYRVVAQRQIFYEAVYTGHARGLFESLLVDVGVGRCYVARYALAEDDAVLHHHSAAAAPLAAADAAQVGVAYAYSSGLGVVIA